MSTRKLPDEAFSDEFPRAIGRPANAALTASGIRTLEQVAAMTEADLLAMHGVGPKAVSVLRDALAASGLRFAD